MPWPSTGRQARGYGRAWERVRERVLERDRHLCQRCARKDRVTVGNEVHHIVPRAQRGTDADTNLETLCRACHEEADAETQGRTLKPKQRFDDKGYPIPEGTNRRGGPGKSFEPTPEDRAGTSRARPRFKVSETE